MADLIFCTEQIAILCKKVDEEVDLDNVDEKSAKFKHLTMDIVWEFAFFEQTNDKLTKRYPNLFRDGNTKSVAVAKASKIMKPYGWLNTLYDLALDGVFTNNGKDAIQSVKDESFTR